MPKRKQIYDAIQGALLASTGINYVTIDVDAAPFSWTNDKYPAVRIYDGDGIITRLAYPGSTSVDDMECNITFEFEGYVSRLNTETSSTDSIDTKRTTLMADIEKSLTQDTTIASLVKDITAQELGTDRGYSEGIGWTNGVFKVMYHYNYLNP